MSVAEYEYAVVYVDIHTERDTSAYVVCELDIPGLTELFQDAGDRWR